MKVVRVHGVVVVASGKCKVALLLVDRDEKEVCAPVLEIEDALAKIGGLFVAEGGQSFACGIGGVKFHSPSPPCIFEKRIVEGLRGREIAAELSNLRFDPGEGEEHPVGFLSL